MEITDKVIDSLLDSMANEEIEIEEPIKEVEKKNASSPPSTKRTRKVTTLLSSPTTVLFSREGKYQAFIYAIFSTETDGYSYKVMPTNRIYDSQRLAVKNAKRWLQKKRLKYYKKHPEKKPRIKTVRIYPKKTKEKVNPIKTINKLYPMKLSVAKILIRMSERKLKLHKNYSRKKWDNKKTTAVSGETAAFNKAIYNVMADGTKNERKLVAKMLKKFTHEPFRKTNMFY